MKQKYSPDILNCLANLSSDEVFTSPELANRMLDLLPQELFHSPKTRFLDPCSKSGVFLREIAKRLLSGLEEQIPDLQERIDHIMAKQVFCIACTDLTAEMSRRTLYCSKHANGEYSVTTALHDQQGNLRYDRCQHTWNEQGRCEHCGASKGEYLRTDSRETYAYPFIHKSIKEIFHKDMQFDVIIGNPPYQLSDGGAQASAIPIYHHFVEQAKKMNPQYLIMIIPSRWFSGGRGLDSFRETMLSDTHLRSIHDYFNSNDVFPGIDLSGGVCYFLWDKTYSGVCEIVSFLNGERTTMTRPLIEKDANTFIRFNQAIDIVRKVKNQREKSFSTIVSSQKPFGLRTYVQGRSKSETSNVLLYSNKNADKGGEGYISHDEVLAHKEWLPLYKVYVSRAYGERGDFPYLVVGKPFLGIPNSCCTETYLTIGPMNSEKEALNVVSYIKTRFFRFLVLLVKNTQDAPAKVYQFVPLQDFSHPWTDEMLYKKYGLTEDEIAFIESMIRPME